MTALLLVALLGAPPQRATAVLDLSARGSVPKDLAQTLSDLLTVEVRRAATGQRVFGSEDIRSLLGFERQKSLLGCQENACLAELGGALGAQEIVAGSISQVADQYVLVLRRLEVAHLRVLADTSVDVDTGSAKKLQYAVQLGVSQLYNLSPPPPLPAPEVVAHPSRVWPWVLIGGAVVAAGASVVGFVEYANYTSLVSQSQSPSTAPTVSAAQSAVTGAQIGLPLGIAGAAVAAGLAVGAVIAW